MLFSETCSAVRRSTTWHPSLWCCSFFFMGCFLFMCVCRRGECGGRGGGGVGSILAIMPEAIVYYSSGRLVCRGRGFKRGSPSRKNFFFIPKRPDQTPFFFPLCSPSVFFLPICPRSRLQFTHFARRHMAALAFRLLALPALSQGANSWSLGRRWEGSVAAACEARVFSLSHTVPLKKDARQSASCAARKLCCEGLRN